MTHDHPEAQAYEDAAPELAKVNTTSKYQCVHCGKDMPADYDPAMCCNGHECACMGMPTNPMVCSQECFEAEYPREDDGTRYDTENAR